MRDLKFLPAVVAAGLLTVGAATAKADIFFNDFGPADSYQQFTAWTISGPTSFLNGDLAFASEFTASMTGNLSSIDLAVGLFRGTNSLTVQLMTDSGGSPGSVIETYNFVDQMGPSGGANPPLIATSSLLNPLLTAGTNYWLAVLPGASDTWAGWNFNNQGVVTGLSGSTDDGATWQAGAPSTAGAFEVFGVASATPEPGSLVLLCTGLATGGGFGWMRRRKTCLVSA